ncbi:MAG: CZB domain-containing protein [Oligoflexales bacterium]|nr:CZB domain-containing protein [Oligoflexales bacterium]
MTEVVKMNFDEAIVAHAEWKLKLTLYLQGEGELNHSVVCQDNQCKLGKWIYSDGKRYANEHTYEHLRKVHADFHRCAGEVIKTVDDGKISVAKQLITNDSEYAKVSTIVIDAISAVKKRVEEKTNLIMQNVNVGVLVVDRGLVVQSGYSQYCHDLFKTEQVAGTHICDLLLLDKKNRSHFMLCFEQVFDDLLPPEVSLSLLPSRTRHGDKVLQLHSSVIRSDTKEIDYILFTVSDVTKLDALETENAENAALLKILRNRESFINFLHDAKESLDQLLDGLIDDQIKVRRDVHTIKGNCGMFDMAQIMRSIGIIEDHEIVTKVDLNSIKKMISDFVNKYKEIIGVEFDQKNDDIHMIAESDLAKLESKLKSITDLSSAKEILLDMTSRLRLRSARSVIGPVEERVQALALRLQKKVNCQVVGENILVNPKTVGPIIQVLAHILRNSIDHGIETAGERLDVGKAEYGSLTISFADRGNSLLSIIVADDGKGIDTAKLVAKAIKKGLISQAQAKSLSTEQKIKLIFADGVSTADEVTDTSGRGVGMSALQASVNAIGGSLVVTSTKGKGTSIEIVIPKAAGHSLAKIAA